MTTAELQREIKRWKQAVKDSRNTIKWLEDRGDQKSDRIRALEQQIKELGGTPGKPETPAAQNATAGVNQ